MEAVIGVLLHVERHRRAEVGQDRPQQLETGERIARALAAQRGVAPAMDQLVRLGEELDLANAAAAALYVETGAGLGSGAQTLSRIVHISPMRSRLQIVTIWAFSEIPRKRSCGSLEAGRDSSVIDR